MTIYLLVAREKSSLQNPTDDLAYTKGSGFYVCAKAAQTMLSCMAKWEEWAVLFPVYAFFLFISIVLLIPGKAIKS